MDANMLTMARTINTTKALSNILYIIEYGRGYPIIALKWFLARRNDKIVDIIQTVSVKNECDARKKKVIVSCFE